MQMEKSNAANQDGPYVPAAVPSFLFFLSNVLLDELHWVKAE